MGNKTFDFSSKKRIFGTKTTKFGMNLSFLVDLGQAMQAYSMPCCGSVGGCGARAVSRKTPIYFMIKLVVMMIAMVTVIAIRTKIEYHSNKNGPPEVLWMCADLTCIQQARLECSGTSPWLRSFCQHYFNISS